MDEAVGVAKLELGKDLVEIGRPEELALTCIEGKVLVEFVLADVDVCRRVSEGVIVGTTVVVMVAELFLAIVAE